MKPTANRKEIQDKLNHYITVMVKSILDSESKKIKKSIKKASKTIAKSIMRKIKDSDGQISLGKKSEDRRPKTEEKKKINASAKQTGRKIIKKRTVKSNVVVKTISPKRKTVAAKPTEKANGAAKTETIQANI